MNSRNYIASAVVALGLIYALEIPAQGVEPLRITIEKTNGESTPAYLQKASERAILWKYTPDAATGNTMARDEIKSIEFELPEGWGGAEQFFDSGAYEESAAAFGSIAEDYKDIMLLKRNPASKAKYLEIESQRLRGDFDKVAEVLNEDTLKILTVSLDDQYSAQLALNQAWAAAAGGNWDVVNQLIAEKSLPKEGGATRSPEFKKEVPPRQMVQLAYMRGLSFDAAGDKEAALADYYRCFTLGYGNNRKLAGKAVLNALAILAADPELADKEEKLKEVKALALMYKRALGSGSIPEQYPEYAVPPPPREDDHPAAAQSGAKPEAPAAPATEKKEGEAEGEKPAEDAKAKAGSEEKAEKEAEKPAK